jgi:hypothetical protein
MSKTRVSGEMVVRPASPQNRQSLVTAGRLPESRSSYTIEHLELINRTLPALIDVSEVPKHRSPVLKTLDREVAVSYMSKVALGMVTAFSSQVDVELPQARLWATIVYEDYKSLRIAEINIIIKNAVKKKQYGAIDVNTMLSWVADYYIDRSDIMSAYREQYHNALKYHNDEEMEGGPAPPELVQYWQKVDKHRALNHAGKARSEWTKEHDQKQEEFRKNKEFLIGKLMWQMEEDEMIEEAIIEETKENK